MFTSVTSSRRGPRDLAALVVRSLPTPAQGGSSPGTGESRDIGMESLGVSLIYPLGFRRGFTLGVHEGYTPKASPGALDHEAPGKSISSSWVCSKQPTVVCLLPKLFDGEIRGKAKSRVGWGEPGTNTIKGLEGLRGTAGGNFPVCTAGEEAVFSSRGHARGML